MSQPTVDFLKAFGDAWNRHDIEALMSMMDDDCVFHAVAGPDLMGKSFVGRDEVRAGFELAWKTFPDAAWLDGDHFVVGDIAGCFYRGNCCGRKLACDHHVGGDRHGCAASGHSRNDGLRLSD